MTKIVGSTTTTPVPRSDWAQTDKAKADFIRHKPELGTIAERDVDDFYTKNEINETLETINNSYDIKGSADMALDSAKAYTDSKSVVIQFVTWGDDD